MADKRDDTTREPLIGGDPLHLGGATDPDAPSRHPRPRILALLGEFLRMSRTSAILLVAFVLVGALYLLVREDPVVGFGPGPATSPTAPAQPETDPVTPTDAASGTAVPTPSGRSTTPGVDSTGSTETTDPADPTRAERRQSVTSVPGGTEGVQAEQTQSQPQGTAPQGGAVPPDAGQTVE